MKTYLKALAIVLLAGILSFALPTLISAKSTELVLGGVMLLVLTPVLLVLLYRALFRKPKQESSK